MNRSAFSLREATLDDVAALDALIAASARGLSQGDYSQAQIEAAIGSAFGVDSELIRDGSYFVAEADGERVGCGGWSRRRTLFGGDAHSGRESTLLDPTVDAARLRAFFVRPDWARRGIGRALIERCEQRARAAGFGAVALMATLPGHRLYQAAGYVGEARQSFTLRGGVPIEFIPMLKALA